MNKLTPELLAEYLDYNPDTGIFTWRKTRTFTARAGSIAGHRDLLGYRVIRLRNQRFKEHRLAWFYIYKTWPAYQIDHINRIKDDNRISNLREALPSQNQINSGMRSNNSSGLRGVRKFKNKWRATIGHNGKIKHLGTFSSKTDAHKTYCKVAKELFGEFADGN